MSSTSTSIGAFEAYADDLNTDGEIDEATIAADALFYDLVAEHNAQNARDRAWDAYKDTSISFSMAHPDDPQWKQKNRLQSNFKNYNATAEELVAVMLQPHKTGVDKNAVNALAGVIINDAPLDSKPTNLSAENIKQIGLLIYECDNGTTPARKPSAAPNGARASGGSGTGPTHRRRWRRSSTRCAAPGP